MPHHRRKYTKEVLEPVVKISFSVAEVCSRLSIFPKGATWYAINRYIKEYQLDMSHFYGQPNCTKRRHLKGSTPKGFEFVLVDGKSQREQGRVLRAALMGSGREYKCVQCDNRGEWQGQPIILHVDHIDGNWRDCRAHNLRFLCPNCHAITPTYGYKGPKMVEPGEIASH